MYRLFCQVVANYIKLLYQRKIVVGIDVILVGFDVVVLYLEVVLVFEIT